MAKDQMYFHMLAYEVSQAHQGILQQVVFADQESSVDQSDYCDSTFMHKFSEVLKETRNLKIDNSVIENCIKSIQRNKSDKKVQFKVAFLEAILSERKFFLNLIKSLLKMFETQEK